MSSLAPIALFVFNRPEHTKKVIEALLKNKGAAETELYIFCDGPKPTATIEQKEKVLEVRKAVKEIVGFKKIFVIEQETNCGLANSIITGVTQVVNQHKKIIVLEDDIIVSPYFLQYMNDGLEVFQNNEQVISIHGYNPPIASKGLPSTFFMRGADCQGWATWKRGWELFEPDGKKLLEELIQKNLINDFNMQGAYPYSQMLQDQIDSKIDSWAIRWHASAFLNNRYTVYPAVSIIYNIGFDNSGVHSGGVDNFNNKYWNNNAPVKINFTSPVKVNKLALKLWKNHFNRINGTTITRKNILQKAYSLLKKFINVKKN